MAVPAAGEVGSAVALAAARPRREGRPAERHQYGGETFLAASRFARGLLQRGGAADGGSWLRGSWALQSTLRHLPRIEVALTGEPGGRAIAAYLEARRRGVRSHLVAQGVLAVPPTLSEYLAGRSRRAVRTNCAHAARAGIACTGISEIGSVAGAVGELIASGLVEAGSLRRDATDCWLIARDGDGETVAGALVTVDREWAMLGILVAASFPARYALHTAVVEALCERGVGHLFARCGSALVLPPGQQYLQRVLGYEVANLSVVRAAR